MPYGYNGKILRVDLTKGKITTEEPGEIFYRRYIGGGALACHYLLREQPAEVNPLGPDNILIFAASAFSGTMLAGFSRYTVAGKSPLTGAFGESEAGGFFGPELKFAGYDAIIIKGRAPKPVYLWLKDGLVEIRDATHLWGKDQGRVQDMIREELGDERVRIAQCGPAGEKLVRYACIINELRHSNGRCGLGAVMGSKNLRAVAVRGHRKNLQFFNPDKLKEMVIWHNQHYLEKHAIRQELGTTALVLAQNDVSGLPTKNFRKGVFDRARDISGQRMNETILTGRHNCYACPIKCKRVVEFKEERFEVEARFGGPEYETLGVFGSACEVADLKAVSKANELCQKYGLDTISTGMTIAFVMDCFDHGILTSQDTDGIDLRFGKAEAMLAMIEKIVQRDGFGNLLAEGTARAAQKIGRGSEKLAMHVKGQELPVHDPRHKRSLALAYAISPTGADHLETPHDPMFATDSPFLTQAAEMGLLEPVNPNLAPEMARYFYLFQNCWSLYNILGVCVFTPWPAGLLTWDHILEYIQAVTGWKMSLWELFKVNERAQNLFREFNLREGFDKKDDTLPDRLFEPQEEGRFGGLNREDFEKVRETYYRLMGWGVDGDTPKEANLL